MAPYDIRSLALEGLPFVLVGNDDDNATAEGNSAMTYYYDNKSIAHPHNSNYSSQRRPSNENHHDELAADVGTPSHPVPEMQAAFQESLIEATNSPEPNKPSLRSLDARGRRQQLIEQRKDETLPYITWRYRPSQTQHELWKLMAQISFGVYLLLMSRSNSTDQVIMILQGHIDDIDEFLEIALEDLAEASRDLTSRIQHLRLPMENRQVFEKLLEDRNFRAELMSGSETIEHVLNRTTLFIDQCEDDIYNGFGSTKAFSRYLKTEANGSWRIENPGVESIYDAMVNNTDGWHKTFVTLDERNRELNELVVSLTQMVADMQRIAGEVSRRTWISIEPFSTPIGGQAAIQAAHLSHISQATHTSPPSSLVNDGQSVRSFTSTRKSIRLPMPSTSSVMVKPQSPHTGDGALTPPPDDGFRMQIGFNDMMSVEVENESGIRRTTIAVRPNDDEFILQPRVYTPKPSTVPNNETPLSPPESHASPQPQEEDPIFLLSNKRYSKNHPISSTASDSASEDGEEVISPQAQSSPSISLPRQRTSLRQRVSLKGHAPQNISIPPAQPRQVSAPPMQFLKNQLSPQSAYVGTVDSHFRNRSNSSNASLSPNLGLPHLTIPSTGHSPHGETQQFYHPVLASPHSPLQQRPHTSHNTPRIVPTTPTGNGMQPQYFNPAVQTRNIPSRSGGASTLSMATAMTYEIAPDGTRRQVKKKKSKFGWLKKAFQLDEEEKAAFEARRQMQTRNLYYDERSSQFLDGRRR